MQRLGFETGKSDAPVMPGEAKTAWALSTRLFEEGVFATAIALPTVSRGKGRIRPILSAAHSQKDLTFAPEKFAKMGRELGVIGS